jgi:hypothetical protein
LVLSCFAFFLCMPLPLSFVFYLNLPCQKNTRCRPPQIQQAANQKSRFSKEKRLSASAVRRRFRYTG